MPHSRLCALALALAGCASNPDIVARLAPAAADQDAGPPKGGAGPGTRADATPGLGALACDRTARDLILLGKAGSLSRVAPVTLELTQLGTADCLAAGALAAALDHTGLLWVVTQDQLAWLVDLKSLACKPLKLGSAISALTFVYDPKTEREMLYVVDADTLYVVDPGTLEPAALGPLKASRLGGTGSGELLAIQDDGSGILITLSIDLTNADVTAKWSTKRPSDAFFAAGVAWGDDLTLVFEAELFGYRRDIDAETRLSAVAPKLTSIVSAAASVCAKDTK